MRERLLERGSVDWRRGDFAAADGDDGHALVIKPEQGRIGVNVTFDDGEAKFGFERTQRIGGLFAEAAVQTSVEDDFAAHALRVLTGRGLAGVVTPAAGFGAAVSGARSSDQPRPSMPTSQVPIDTTCGNVSQSFTSKWESTRR